ncbi:MAG: hypothetical protein BAJALOKI1v1_2440005 [Promethearchaeota archaeon]|nr:MAG: hypothetical protein BAJALOKI1v1_2440005 [Candidatus Lokiarchaeota archaeon]
MKNKDFFTVEETGREIGVDIQKIYRKIDKGEIETVERYGRLFISSEDVLKLRKHYKRKEKLVPFEKFLEIKGISRSKYYRDIYNGKDYPCIVKVDGKLYYDSEKEKENAI